MHLIILQDIMGIINLTPEINSDMTTTPRHLGTSVTEFGKSVFLNHDPDSGAGFAGNNLKEYTADFESQIDRSEATQTDQTGAKIAVLDRPIVAEYDGIFDGGGEAGYYILEL
ncbi:hypothetical protein HYFRA_00008996 [Hymenoscyphus fraxineus]|uniref:Uncharacterized protein n=1 Tax=Hymenoscyphus fraxineus TaxID=746836 RepID=A0A9N9KWG3_9HELO|nr:hypothetical protein HYFRA_00008996 [Hymenoscyphus fraxineus]